MKALKKMDFEIDSETKNLIINGDREHLAMMLRKIQKLYENNDYEDSLETEEFKNIQRDRSLNESLTLSKSEEPQKATNFKATGLVHNLEKMRKT